MILIEQEYLERVRTADSFDTLREMVADAVTLELATLPTYLTGVFSVKPESNSIAKALVQSVAHEEMLHMTLACSLLLGIGGTPRIYEYGSQLQFPTKLPLGVIPELVINLDGLTRRQIYDTFMAIECPDSDSILPGENALHWIARLRKKANERGQGQGYGSIGDFYSTILRRLSELQYKFDNPQLEKQIDVSQWFPPAVKDNPTGRVTCLKTAEQVVETIISEGEGAAVSSDPIDPRGGLQGSFAHYFKFAEIYYGRKLIEDPSSITGWSYTGAPIELSEDGGIYAFRPNTALSDYTQGTAAHHAASEFYSAYLRLLRCLDNSFSGAPKEMNAAIGLMYELKLLAGKLALYRFDPSDPTSYVCTPPFMAHHPGEIH